MITFDDGFRAINEDCIDAIVKFQEKAYANSDVLHYGFYIYRKGLDEPLPIEYGENKRNRDKDFIKLTS